MKVLTESLAFAAPKAPADLNECVRGYDEARAGERKLEVRIGVGPLFGEIPARLVSYASCIAGEVNVVSDLFGRHPDRIAVFSSAPKAGYRDPIHSIVPLGAFGIALRLVGCTLPIILDVAEPAEEITPDLRARLPAPLAAWIESAADNHQGQIGYAYEHAAASMFADIAANDDQPFRVTLGGKTEAPYWAVRAKVREAALEKGVMVTPAFGLILKSLRRPWYQPTVDEPPISAIADPQAAIRQLDRAANPKSGNSGLNREARELARVFNGNFDADRMISATSSLAAVIGSIEQFDFEVGQRLRAQLEGEKT